MRSYPKNRSLSVDLRFFVCQDVPIELQAKPSGILWVKHIVRRLPARFELPGDVPGEIGEFEELSLTWVTEVDGITADGTPKPFVALCSASGTMPSPPPIAQDDISFKRLLQQGDLCNENYLGNRCKDRFLFFKIGTKNMRAKTKNQVEGNISKSLP
mgnify:FL=1